MRRDERGVRRSSPRARRLSFATVVRAAATLALVAAASALAQRVPAHVPPPYLQTMIPDKGHIVGGTTVTIYGGGFHNHAGLSVRFSFHDLVTDTIEIDVVKATYVDFGTIRVVTPPRKHAGDVHVTVSNNGVGYSTTPLNTETEGTFLTFVYANTAPSGNWVIKNATGHSLGGAVVEIRNPAHTSSARFTEANFLPGVPLRSRFGDPADQSSTTTFTIGTAMKTEKHPWFGRGGTDGYTVTSARLNGGSAAEGPSFIVKRGLTYTFSINTPGHPFYVSTVEPAMWERSYDSRLTNAVTSGSITLSPDANTPDIVFYHSTSFSFMGGMIVVINSTATDFETGASNANTVRAEWLSYNVIRCVAPPWVNGQDDNTEHGGKQVTVYVSNDGVTYHSGKGGADSATPADRGNATTFTYFDNSAFLDAPIYFAASASTNYVAGVALALTSSKHTVSSIYADDGTLDTSANTSFATAFTAHETEKALSSSGSGAANDLVVEGTYSGGGVAWFEVVIDDDSNATETFRWRLHTHVGSTVDWAATARAIPVGLNGGSISPSGSLSDGISIRFTSSGSHHNLGDRWLIRVIGTAANVIEARTTHEEPEFLARGPFYGNTEITIIGQGFFPSSDMKCKLHDSDTAVTHFLPVMFDSPQRVRCITKSHEPRSGGEVPGTIRPCFKKDIQVSIDGTSYSAVKSSVNFLYCDVYVSTSGSDTFGDGTPKAPYLTLQRAFEASLGEARSYDLRYEVDNLKTGIRGGSQFRSVKFGSSSRIPINRGFGYFVNRDKVRVKSGMYTGAGNIGLHPLGKMLEVESKDGQVLIDCAQQATGMLVNGDRHGTEEVTNSGSVSFFGVTHVNCE